MAGADFAEVFAGAVARLEERRRNAPVKYAVCALLAIVAYTFVLLPAFTFMGAVVGAVAGLVAAVMLFASAVIAHVSAINGAPRDDE